MAEVGRPTKMTPETIAKLEEAFIMGCSDREASLFAGINPSTLGRYCEDNEEFRVRKELLKEQPKLRARANVSKALNAGDTALSQWYLERKGSDEFSTKSKVEGSGEMKMEVVIRSVLDK